MKYQPERETTTETKLAVGQRNPIWTSFEFHAADSVPFDVSALYSYLLTQTERQSCNTAAEIVAIFEAEFATIGAVPDLVTITVADRLVEIGIDDTPSGDDLKRDALVTLFVDEYSRAFAVNPGELPDPRGVRETPRSRTRDHLTQLYRRFADFFNYLRYGRER